MDAIEQYLALRENAIRIECALVCFGWDNNCAVARLTAAQWKRAAECAGVPDPSPEVRGMVRDRVGTRSALRHLARLIQEFGPPSSDFGPLPCCF
jgi:hypothetical protein